MTTQTLNRFMRRAAQREKQPTRQQRTAKDLASWLWRLEACRPYEAAEVAGEVVTVRAAFERLRTGHGTQDDFDHVAMALNVTLARATEIDERLVQMVLQAQNACERVQQRGKLVFDGPGLIEVMDGLDVFQEILENSSPQQMVDARQAVIKVIQRQQMLRKS